MALDLVEQALSAANPQQTKTPGYTVSQLLQDIERDLDEKVKGQPEIEASVRHTIGAAYNGLGLHRQAKPHLERALALRKELLGEDHELTLLTRYERTHVLRNEGRAKEAAEAMGDVWEVSSRVLGAEHPNTVRAGLAYANDLVDLARYAEAEAVLLPVRRTAHEALGPSNVSTLETDTVLSYLRVRQGRFDEAATVTRESYDRILELCGESSHYLGYPLGQLVHVEQGRGRYKEAEAYARQLWKLHCTTLGPEHPWSRTMQYRVADMLRSQGRLEEARALYEEALAFFRAHQPNDPHTTAVVFHNLAEVERLAGDYATAERYLRASLDISSRSLGEHHPNHAMALSALATIHKARGHFADAEEAERKAVDILERTYGCRHPTYASAVEGLGILANNQGRYQEGEKHLRTSTAIYEESHGREHTVTARGYANLASCLLEQGQYAEAEELYLRSHRILAKTVPGHAHVGAALNSLGELYRRMSRFDEAAEYLEAALAFQQEKLGPRHEAVAATLGNLGLVHAVTGAVSEARACFERALEILQAAHGEQHPQVALALGNLATLASLTGDLPAAESGFTSAIGIYRKAFGPRHVWEGRVLVELSGVLVKQGRHQDARNALESALPILREAYGRESEHALRPEISLANLLRDLGDPQGAIAELERIRPRVVACVGEDGLLNAVVWQGLAMAAGALGRGEDAIEYGEKAVGITVRGEPGGPNELAIRGTLARLLHQNRRWADAAEQWEMVVALSRRLHGPRSRTVCAWLTWYATSLEGLGRFDEAVAAYAEAVGILREIGAIEGGDLAVGELTLDALRARRLMHRGEREAAEEAFRRVLEDHAGTLAREDAFTAEMLSSLGASFQTLRRLAEAEALYRRSYDRYASILGLRAPNTLGTASRLALALGAQEKHAEAVDLLEGLVGEERIQPASRAMLQAVFGLSLLGLEKPVAAEKTLRACVAFREEAMPGHWLTWNAVSLLGQSLADQGRHEEAEPLLLESYEKMDPPAVSAHRKEEARARLVRLYEGWGKPEMADRWRAPSEEAEPDLDEPPDGTDDSTSPDVRTR